jgi:hypothetical protein
MHNKVANNDSLPVKTRYSRNGNDRSLYKLMAFGKFQIFSFWGVDFSEFMVTVVLYTLKLIKTIS